MSWGHFWRGVTIGFGAIWAGGLLLGGFWMWQMRGTSPMVTATTALVPLAAGWFVWMYLVADAVCPRASMNVTGFSKLVVGLIFWGAVGLTVARLLS